MFCFFGKKGSFRMLKACLLAVALAGFVVMPVFAEDAPAVAVEDWPDDAPETAMEVWAAETTGVAAEENAQGVTDFATEGNSQEATEAVAEDNAEQTVEPVSENEPKETTEPIAENKPEEKTEPIAENEPEEKTESATENKPEEKAEEKAEEKGDDSASVVAEEKSDSSGAMLWFFDNVVQPFFNMIVWPVSQPLHYAFDNGVIETFQKLITFGKDENIFIYPVFNFKPGSSTQVGLCYRHRRIFLDDDYFVLNPSRYANGDMDFDTRYSKHGILGLPLSFSIRFTLDLNRDASFTRPGSWTSYVQPDSSYKVNGHIGFPLNSSGTLSMRFNYGFKYVDASVPNVAEDEIYIEDDFPIQDRGLYQEHLQYPLGLQFIFDNLDFPYVPSKGFKVVLSGSYNFVEKYKGVRYSDLGLYGDHKSEFLEDGGKNHDYINGELIVQRYFYLGKAPRYVMSASEGRENRRFYTNFSWNEAARVWSPSNMKENLFERRVIALQYRFLTFYEMEKGGAPFNAYPILNGRFPLRGYGGFLMTKNVMGLSAEYRWPVDRYVDGVIFDEYALYTEKINDWSFDRFRNSWGFGVRVRKPDMYFFRLQFGFHGLKGVKMVITVAPEFK